MVCCLPVGVVTVLRSFIWNQRRCQSSTRLLRAGVCWHGIPACVLISCDATDTSRIPACVTYQRCPPPTLYSPVCYVWAYADTGRRHVRLSAWTWMTIVVTKHPPQRSERVLIFLDPNWSQYSDHTQVLFAHSVCTLAHQAYHQACVFYRLWDRGCIWNYMHLVNLSICNNLFTWSKTEPAFDYQQSTSFCICR